MDLAKFAKSLSHWTLATKQNTVNKIFSITCKKHGKRKYTEKWKLVSLR